MITLTIQNTTAEEEAKEFQKMISDPRGIYDDVDYLMEKVPEIEASVAGIDERLGAADVAIAQQGAAINALETAIGAVADKVADTGWVDLELINEIEIYGNNTTPQVRRIGDVVYLRGSIKNLLADDTIIATLPKTFRPSRSHWFVQNTTYNSETKTANFARWHISTKGEIKVQYISEGAEYGPSKWFTIDTVYTV